MKSIKTKYISILLVSVLIFTFSSCGIGLLIRGGAKRNFTKEKEVIPESFISKDAKLLIMMWGNESYDKYVKKAFDKYYLGKKEYVGFSQLTSKEKYSDLEKYPFTFSQGPGDKAMYSGQGYSYSYSGSRPFHIYDRQNDKFYMANRTSGFFYRIMQAYAMKMEYYRTNP